MTIESLVLILGKSSSFHDAFGCVGLLQVRRDRYLVSIGIGFVPPDFMTSLALMMKVPAM